MIFSKKKTLVWWTGTVAEPQSVDYVFVVTSSLEYVCYVALMLCLQYMYY